MKKIIYILLIFCTVLLYSSDLKFFNNFIVSQKEAKKLNKNILLMFSQQGCPTCEYMEEIAFEDALLSNYMNNHFVLVKLDINKDTIPSYLKVHGTPTFYILNQQGEKLGRPIVGGGTAEAFLKLLKAY